MTPHDQIRDLPETLSPVPQARQRLMSGQTLILGHFARPKDPINGGESDSVLLSVFAGSFAERLRRLLYIDDVVYDLKRRPDVFSEPSARPVVPAWRSPMRTLARSKAPVFAR